MYRGFLLIDAAVVPQIFIKVLEAKKLLASGQAKNISTAIKMADISRSAFYKYKDSVFTSESVSDIVTANIILLDELGALQEVLALLSKAGANVVSINQALPANGTAEVSITMKTAEMQLGLNETLKQLKMQKTVVEVKCNA